MQRRFCSMTLARLVRLSAHLAFIQKEVLPADNDQWLLVIPASDAPPPLPPNPDQPGTLDAPYEALMQRVVEKTPDSELVEIVRGGALGGEGAFPRSETLRVLVRVVLVRGKATPYHTSVLVERYTGCLGTLMREARAASSTLVLCSSAALLVGSSAWCRLSEPRGLAQLSSARAS